MNLYEELNLKNKSCFDIGANVGKKTERFLAEGASSVVCIEPQGYCIPILESKFLQSGKVNILKAALGSNPDIKTLYISEDYTTLSTMSTDFMRETKKQRFSNTVWDKEESVQVFTLDSIIEKYGFPYYCKIDVEGYEVEILKGLSIPINYISLEFVPELKQKTFQCIEILNNLGEYKYNYIEGESEFFTFSEWLDSKEIFYFLSEKNDFGISFGDLYAKKIR